MNMIYLKKLTSEYEKTCDLIHHYENYEPDQFELERGEWRTYAKERANSLKETLSVLKDDIELALETSMYTNEYEH